jgi:hypothetical protein
MLNTAVIEHLDKIDYIPPSLPLIIKVFAAPGDQTDRLNPFAAIFSSAYLACNLTPVADKQMVKIKIEENFDLFEGDENCKYILLAVNHEPMYTGVLLSCKDRIDVGLLHVGLIHIDYQLLNLETVEFKSIFLNPTSDCEVDSEPEPEPIWTDDRLPNPYSLLKTHPVDKEGLVPIDKDGNMIEFPISTALREEEKAFNMRHEVHRICLNHHIGTDGCQRMFCPNDHSYVENTVLRYAVYMLSRQSCRSKGACRRRVCGMGHHCQEELCFKDGKTEKCRIATKSHGIDTVIAKWVQPVEIQPGSKAAMGTGTLIDLGVLDKTL